MKVLAIDPGYERLGLAVIEKDYGKGIEKKEHLLFSDCFKTSALLAFEDRLLLLGQKVEDLIQIYSPDALSIENLFITNNQKTAMRVSEVRGALLYIAKKHNLLVKEFTPLQIKLSVTGDGRSTKDQMIKMVTLLIPSLKTSKKKTTDDEYDAIAIGLAFFAYYKEPIHSPVHKV